MWLYKYRYVERHELEVDEVMQCVMDHVTGARSKQATAENAADKNELSDEHLFMPLHASLIPYIFVDVRRDSAENG